jgi:copper chaperone
MKNRHLTVLDVEGMSCGSCVRHIDGALRALSNVSSVDVQLREGRVLVQHDRQSTGVPELIAALSAEGYPARESTAD